MKALANEADLLITHAAYMGHMYVFKGKQILVDYVPKEKLIASQYSIV